MLFRHPARVFEPSAPVADAVPLNDMAEHLRVDASDEYYLIGVYTQAAAAIVEARTQRLLTARTCVLRLPCLPSDMTAVELPGGYVSAVASVVVDGVTVSPSAYAVAGHSPARLMPLAAWPVVVGEGLPVVITYTAGYATTPHALRMAVMLIAAELFEQRRDASEANLTEVPVSARYLMEPFAIRAIG